MDRFVDSEDGTRIHYQVSGRGDTALLLAHGWLGTTRWWDATRDHLADRYTIAAIDLAGHGASARTRTEWSSRRYADDLCAVAAQLDARRIILVGHSMSGAYVVEACPRIARTAAIVLVDTLKDLDRIMPRAQVEQMLALYRRDFAGAVRSVLPQYLFAETSPKAVRERILDEFLAADPAFAVSAIEPLYAMDVRVAAARVTVPVRAINASFTPTNREANRACFRDFDYVELAGCGHYPMLEAPDDFNRALEATVAPL